MNRMYVPKRPPKRKRREAPAQIELTLELPRGPKEEIRSESAEMDAERGVAVVDFYI